MVCAKARDFDALLILRSTELVALSESLISHIEG